MVCLPFNLYSGGAGATNPLLTSLSQFQPALAAALASQAAQQQFVVASQSNSLNAALQQAQQQAAAAAQQHHQYFDYASLQAAAAANQQAAAAAGLIPQASNGIDQYGYPYGVIGAHPNLSHLNAAAQAQLAVAASGSGQMKLDNQH
uniref:Uncharacterized protein n=1 Tax=Panagrolaimus sp. ES5 TaxID=591445 RepID=A0AC34GQJ9_9BILA